MNTYSNDGRLRLIVGRSGSGKDYLLNTFGLTKVASCTTRGIRPGEIDGIGHTFKTYLEFAQTSNDDMVAYTLYNGNHYWVTADMLNDIFAYVVDPVGIKYMQKFKHKIKRDMVIILVVTPLWRRVRNMYARGDSIKDIWKRIWNDRDAFRDFEKSGNYDYLIHM